MPSWSISLLKKKPCTSHRLSITGKLIIILPLFPDHINYFVNLTSSLVGFKWLYLATITVLYIILYKKEMTNNAYDRLTNKILHETHTIMLLYKYSYNFFLLFIFTWSHSSARNKGISFKTSRTGTDRYMVFCLTVCSLSAGSSTYIYTLVIHAGLVLCTFYGLWNNNII